MKNSIWFTASKFAAIFIIAFLIFTANSVEADQELISLFPLDNYSQTVTSWIKPDDADYDKPLLSADMQQQRMDEFYNHYFGAASPWNRDNVNQVLRHAAPDDLKTIEQDIIASYSNQEKPANKIGYGENFRPHTQNWIDTLANNIKLSALDNNNYHASQRGIVIDNTHARMLPTNDVYFYNHQLAGEGYPFDNLQISALWVGTPVYIITDTRDHAWLLVLTPDYIGWVKSNSIARASDHFINQWQKSAKNKLAAITKTETSLLDEKGEFIIPAYVGSVFPVTIGATGMQLMVPVADAEHRAVIKTAKVTADQADIMPVTTTPQHFAAIINTMIHRPYGWGGMYFYNDCSAETKYLLTPFGIYVPRHSSLQVTAGKLVDQSSLPQTERLAYLIQNGHKFLTLIYIGGHVVLYIGNYPHGSDQSPMAMTYQNIWGLSPEPATRRAVIGQSVLFPMLAQYPEDPTLTSPAGKKYFQLAFLDQVPEQAGNTLMLNGNINMRALMSAGIPE